MRRLVSSILAILVLALSCFPCCDADAMHAGDRVAETIFKAASDNDCGSSHADDFCSPFCTCSCCAGFTIPTHETVALRPIQLFAERTFASYLPQAVADIALPIWQPPQFV